MPRDAKYALITGSSRGIGRGIALKLAELGTKIAIHYYKNERAAEETLAEVRKRDSDGFIVQADVTRPEEIKEMFRKVQAQFKKLDVFVSNARPEVPAFFQGPRRSRWSNGTPRSIRSRRRSSSGYGRRFRSRGAEEGSSPSPTPKGAAREACNPGWAWARRRRRSSRSCGTSRWRSPGAGSR